MSDRQLKSLTFHNCYQNFHFLLRKAIANHQKVVSKQQLDKKEKYRFNLSNQPLKFFIPIKQLNIPIQQFLIFPKLLQNISRTCVISAIWYHTDT
ncbi:MAG: hypothetical protein F6K54_33885 [Okeania sp. SIO3B5]|uniref:hypothetical protein n=1 Tax=Okeania sp. SIO3B5 TaxID=2607811 RepID=UPI0013FEF231|nr:hypothetical protein [Okeania sp. SIO3B5]NEO57624.1 hypothetical protein [Okeania sp. SIO3B5]